MWSWRNDKSRVYYVERLSDLQAFSKTPKAQEPPKAATAAGNIRTGRSEQIGGLPATQYFITTASPEGGNREAEVWITHNFIPPVQLHETLKKIFSIDTNKFPPGLPLRIKMARRSRLKRKANLRHHQCAEANDSHPLPSLTTPTYKRVDSELAVLMDEKSRKKMESILDDSDDLSSILGSAGAPGSGSHAGSSGSKPSGFNGSEDGGFKSTAKVAPKPQPAVAAAAKPAAKNGGDWWTNMLNAMTGK